VLDVLDDVCFCWIPRVVLGKFGMFCGPVSMASKISRGVAFMRLGA